MQQKSLTWWVTVDKVLVGRIMSKKKLIVPPQAFLLANAPFLESKTRKENSDNVLVRGGGWNWN